MVSGDVDRVRRGRGLAPTGSVRFDAFLSYSHTDRALAAVVERSVRRFAAPWYRTRTLRVFRDETSLAHDASLWAGIERSLERSRWFILIASPESASRPWVNREVEWWLANRGTSHLLVGLARGEIRWLPEVSRLESEALPLGLQTAWQQEPLWLDLRTAAAAGKIAREDAIAYSAIASMASAVTGIPKDELVGEDVRQQRRAMRLLKIGIVAVVISALVAVAAAVVAVEQRDRAMDQQRTAEANARRATAVALSLQASAAENSNPALATALALQSYSTTEEPLTEAIGALVSARAALAGRRWQAVGPALVGHADVVNDVTFSRDGRMVASASSDHTIRLWRTATGEPTGEPLNGHAGSVENLAFSPDGTRLTSVAEDGSVRLWNVATQRTVGRPVRVPGFWPALNASGSRVATVVGPLESVVRVFDTATGQPVGPPLVGSHRSVSVVAFSGDGSRLASGGVDGTVRLWDPRTGERIGEPLSGHRHDVDALTFSPDGDMLASGGWDGTVRLWDTDTGRSVGAPLVSHASVKDGGGVSDLAFSPDGSLLVSASDDSTIRMWDSATRQAIGTPIAGHRQWVSAVAFSPDGSLLASAGADRTVRLWDLWLNTAPGNSTAIEEAVTARELDYGQLDGVAFSPDGEVFAIALDALNEPNDFGGFSSHDEVQLWDVATRSPIGGPLARGFIDGPLVFSPNGALLAFASDSGDRVELWDIASRTRLGEPLGASSPMAFSPDGTTLATGTTLDSEEAARKGTVLLWDVSEQQIVERIAVSPPSWTTAVTFSPDGTVLASASDDGAIRLVDTSSGDAIGQTLKGHLDAVNDLEFSPDGSLLASASDDQTIRLWRTESGTPVGTPLTGHDDAVEGLDFSPNGQILISGGVGGLRVWDPADGTEIGSALTSRKGPGGQYIEGVAFHPNGVLVASWGFLDTLRFWNVLDAAGACEIVKPYLTEYQLSPYLVSGAESRGCMVD